MSALKVKPAQELNTYKSVLFLIPVACYFRFVSLVSRFHVLRTDCKNDNVEVKGKVTREETGSNLLPKSKKHMAYKYFKIDLEKIVSFANRLTLLFLFQSVSSLSPLTSFLPIAYKFSY